VSDGVCLWTRVYVPRGTYVFSVLKVGCCMMEGALSADIATNVPSQSGGIDGDR
jgi:hypothetical protein